MAAFTCYSFAVHSWMQYVTFCVLVLTQGFKLWDSGNSASAVQYSLFFVWLHCVLDLGFIFKCNFYICWLVGVLVSGLVKFYHMYQRIVE